MTAKYIFEPIKGWRVFLPFSIGLCLALAAFLPINFKSFPLISVPDWSVGFVLAGLMLTIVLVTPLRSRLMWFLAGFVGGAFTFVIKSY